MKLSILITANQRNIGKQTIFSVTGAAFTTSTGSNQQWYGNMENQYQQSYYGNIQQMSGINSFAPQTSYYAGNQQTSSNYGNGQGYNWQQNNYQQG